MKEITGRDIRNLRKRTKLNQTEFAREIGLAGQSWLSAIENGRAPVSRHVLRNYELLREKYSRARSLEISPALFARTSSAGKA